jgi:hypothetical protein
MFITLSGTIKNLIYELSDKGKEYKRYKYNRLIDGKIEPIEEGTALLRGAGFLDNQVHTLSVNTLHTVTIKGHNVMWLIIELQENPKFQQIAYSQNVLQYRSELYQKMDDPIEYINKKLKLITK